MSLNANISENSLVSEQANVVPNKTIASRLREAHGTTGETIATAIPGAGPVMYVDTDITEVDGTTYYVLTKTFNEIKQAIDNNIFVVIKRKVDEVFGTIEYIESIYDDPEHDECAVYTIAMDRRSGDFVINKYSTDNSNGYPTHAPAIAGGTNY